MGQGQSGQAIRRLEKISALPSIFDTSFFILDDVKLATTVSNEGM